MKKDYHSFVDVDLYVSIKKFTKKRRRKKIYQKNQTILFFFVFFGMPIDMNICFSSRHLLTIDKLQIDGYLTIFWISHFFFTHWLDYLMRQFHIFRGRILNQIYVTQLCMVGGRGLKSAGRATFLLCNLLLVFSIYLCSIYGFNR